MRKSERLENLVWPPKINNFVDAEKEIEKISKAYSWECATPCDLISVVFQKLKASIEERIKTLENVKPDEYFSQPLVNEINHRIDELRKIIGSVEQFNSLTGKQEAGNGAKDKREIARLHRTQGGSTVQATVVDAMEHKRRTNRTGSAVEDTGIHTEDVGGRAK